MRKVELAGGTLSNVFMSPATVMKSALLALALCQSTQVLALGTEDVVRLKASGYSEEEILEVIAATQSAFLLTARDVVYLARSGVPAPIIQQMLVALPTDPSPAEPPETVRPAFTGEDLQLLADGGVPEPVVITFIETREMAFTLDTPRLTALRNAGMGLDALQLLVERSAATLPVPLAPAPMPAPVLAGGAPQAPGYSHVTAMAPTPTVSYSEFQYTPSIVLLTTYRSPWYRYSFHDAFHGYGYAYNPFLRFSYYPHAYRDPYGFPFYGYAHAWYHRPYAWYRGNPGYWHFHRERGESPHHGGRPGNKDWDDRGHGRDSDQSGVYVAGGARPPGGDNGVRPGTSGKVPQAGGAPLKPGTVNAGQVKPAGTFSVVASRPVIRTPVNAGAPAMPGHQTGAQGTPRTEVPRTRTVDTSTRRGVVTFGTAPARRGTPLPVVTAPAVASQTTVTAARAIAREEAGVAPSPGRTQDAEDGRATFRVRGAGDRTASPASPPASSPSFRVNRR